MIQLTILLTWRKKQNKLRKFRLLEKKNRKYIVYLEKKLCVVVVLSTRTKQIENECTIDGVLHRNLPSSIQYW